MSPPKTNFRRITLDKNVLIDVETRRDPRWSASQRILDAASRRECAISIPAVAGSENPRPGEQPTKNFREFQDRVAAAFGLTNIEYLAPMLYADVGFLGYSVLGGGALLALEQRIHEILRPYTVPIEKPNMADFRRWMNKKADVQTVWCHVYYETNVLATSDEGLVRKADELRDAVGANVQHVERVAADLGPARNGLSRL